MWCLPIILSLLITIIAIRHFREVYASECVGEAVVAVGSIRCTRLSFEQSLSTTCSGDVYRNGVLLNKTGQVFIINSLADYGVYGCCSKADGILNYFVFPRDCDVCAQFVTVDTNLYNLTHINVTCVIHIAISYCCKLHQKDIIDGHAGYIKQGLSEIPPHPTSYYCSCSFKCRDANYNNLLISVIGSNRTIFDPTNVTFTAVSTTSTSTAASASDVNNGITVATPITVVAVSSSASSTSIAAAASYVNNNVTATTVATTVTTLTTVVTVTSSASSTPTGTCNMVDNEAQDRASTAGEIIGSFMAGVMVAATIILLTGALCIWTTKRNKESSDQTAHTRRISIPTRTASLSGLGIEFIKGNRVVRYHPAPVNPPAGDMDEHNDATSCLDDEVHLDGVDNTNASSSNIDISSRACSNSNGNTQGVQADVEPVSSAMPNDTIAAIAIADVTTPEQCTQVRNFVVYDHEAAQEFKRRTQSFS